jgi:hypothetical protein
MIIFVQLPNDSVACGTKDTYEYGNGINQGIVYLTSGNEH